MAAGPGKQGSMSSHPHDPDNSHRLRRVARGPRWRRKIRRLFAVSRNASNQAANKVRALVYSTKTLFNPGFGGTASSRGMVRKERLRRFGLVAAIAVGTLLALLVTKVASQTSIIKLPTLAEQKAGVEIFDREDKLLTVVQKSGERQPVPLSEMSPYIRQAVIGIEDHSFYHHAGIDPLGITRAIYKNAKARQLVQGGSTITQQLIKTMYFGHEDRTARRKLLEVIMALDVETCYSKDKILETYLNQVYFGRGACGIERAACTYFNKPAKKLSLHEAAFLAALIKAPSDLGRPSNVKRAQERQKEVLDGMVECRFITRDEADKAKALKLAFKTGPHPYKHPHYVNQVISILKQDLGENRVFEKPIKVYTNLDTSAQQAAELALDAGVKSAPAGIDQGAVASIDLETGGIIAMVGGVGPFKTSQWNRAVNPHTAGSAFKPFVYLAGLIDGTIGPNSILNDAPIALPLPTGEVYTPKNYDGTFKGLMTVRDAIALSRNVCAVQVGQQTGIENVITVARRAGLTSPMDPVPALALGTCAVSPLEMANAYATLARGGDYVEPQFIRFVKESDGKVIKEYSSKLESRLPAEPVYQLVDAMEDVVTVGTGKKARIPGVATARKTGTADDSKDVWFVGFTPDVVTAVWAGNDDNNAIHHKGITGGTIAAGIWSSCMNGYYKTHPKPRVAFTAPKHPLAHSLPYIAFFPRFVSDAVEDIVEGVERAATPIIQEVTPAGRNSNNKMKKKSFIGKFLSKLF